MQLLGLLTVCGFISNFHAAIARDASVIHVSTEAELKDALIDGSTIVITQNITLTSSINIWNGTSSVSVI